MSTEDNLKQMRRALAIAIFCTYPPDAFENLLDEFEKLLRKVALDVGGHESWHSAMLAMSPSDNQVIVPDHLLPEVDLLSNTEFIPAYQQPASPMSGNSTSSLEEPTTTPACCIQPENP